jgi:hypothetical protein
MGMEHNPSNDLLLYLCEAARRAFAEQGLILVPRNPTRAMLEALDRDGDRIWAGGTEHYFRNEDEAFWYAKQVWHAMIEAAQQIPVKFG